MKKVVVSVSNDLITDNRVDKTCSTLVEAGYDVHLIGRLKRNSPQMNKRNYSYSRMHLCFYTSFFFYADFNLRLFFKLLFSKQDILWANDLDTLLANYLVSRIKKIPLIFDSHELFTEVPELKYNRFAKWFWKRVEKRIVPNLKYIVTVCNPIADYFKTEYGVNSIIVRNCPRKDSISKIKSKEDLNMPDKPILVWQGGGCNIERGMEELIESMQWIDAYLYIIGDGDVYNKLKKLASNFGVRNKVSFVPRIPFEDMMQYTFNADIGLSLDKDTNQNYAISLPNKLFEYIHAELPIIITPLNEIKTVVETLNICDFLVNHNPSSIAFQINSLLNDKEKRELYSENCRKVKQILCWEEEQKKIIELLSCI